MISETEVVRQLTAKAGIRVPSMNPDIAKWLIRALAPDVVALIRSEVTSARREWETRSLQE